MRNIYFYRNKICHKINFYLIYISFDTHRQKPDGLSQFRFHIRPHGIHYAHRRLIPQPLDNGKNGSLWLRGVYAVLRQSIRKM